MDKFSKILVTGHNGLVGSALARHLRFTGYNNVLTWPRSDVNLANAEETAWAFSCYRPEYVFHCAARVGGIADNAANPLDFYLSNIAIQNNTIMSAAEFGVKKLLFLGSSCIYPLGCPQPIREDYLMSGKIDSATEPYALAKIGGVRLCKWLHKERGLPYIAALPCNLHGPRDNFDVKTAHVVPGLIARLHKAKIACDPTFKVWGDGTAMREFLLADDLASALVLIMREYDDATEHINAGSSLELTIAKLAWIIAYVVGYEGEIQFDPAQLTGVSRKLLDNSKLFSMGWTPKTDFFEGLRATYRWYMANTT